jgi:hypothetical protein
MERTALALAAGGDRPRGFPETNQRNLAPTTHWGS